MDDTTVLGGQSWADLKKTAMVGGFDVTNLPADDQAKATALIDAQTTQGWDYALQSTTDHSYTDSTVIPSMSWGEFRSIAMAPGYSTAALSTSDQTLVSELKAAQNDNAGGVSASLTATLTTTVLSDTTTIASAGNAAWSTYKTTALASDFDNTSLSADDQALVDLLKTEQNKLSLVALTDTDYTDGTGTVIQINDQTTIVSAGNQAWSAYKTSALAAGFDNTSLSADDQLLVTALTTA